MFVSESHSMRLFEFASSGYQEDASVSEYQGQPLSHLEYHTLILNKQEQLFVATAQCDNDVSQHVLNQETKVYYTSLFV